MQKAKSIRFYVIISILLTFFWMGIYIFMSINLLKKTLYHKETESLKKITFGIQRYFEQKARDLLGQTRDEAVWDDAYEFADTKDPEFIKSSVCISSFTDNNIDLFLYLDLDKKLLAGGWFDEKNNKIVLNNRVKDAIKYLKNNLAIPKPYKKIYWHKNEPILITAHPILKSNGAGTPRGYVVMGKVIKNDYLTDIAHMFGAKRIYILNQKQKNIQIDFKENKAKIIVPNILGDKETALLTLFELENDVNDTIVNIFGIQLFIIVILLIFIFLIFKKKLLYPLHHLKKILENSSKLSNRLATIPDIKFNLKEIDQFYNILKHNLNELYFINQKLIDLNHAISHMMTMSSISDLKIYTKQILKTLTLNNCAKNSVINPQTEKELKRILIKAYSYAKEQINFKNKLKDLAYRDALTNLYNRTFFYEYITTEIQRAKRKNYPIAIIILDLDNLKEINDTFGHSEGDILLKNTAKIIQNVVRKSDIAMRYGGDEFLIVLSETNKQGVETFIARLKNEIEKYNKHHSKDPQISVSIGEAIWYPDSAHSIKDAIKEADKKMYTEKSLKKFSKISI